jgi:sugar (pentulose or hexulose) kinase
VKGIVAAVDLGATSGRVMLGHVSPDEVRLEHILRFPNDGPVQRIDGLHWDIDELFRSILAGLRTALHGQPEIASIGVDSWAVDYALLRDGLELGAPFHYRDDRNLPAVEVVDATISPEELYAGNGLQFLPFNTLYQLTADRTAVRLADAARFLLVPDRINFWLGGTEAAERTNASTTGLLGVTTGHWDSELISRLQVPGSIFPELVDAGTSLGGASTSTSLLLALKTPPPPSSESPPKRMISPTSPAAPGDSSASNSNTPYSPRTAGSRTSPTKAEWMAAFATCTTSWDSGSSANPCAPGRPKAPPSTCPPCCRTPPR